MISAKAPLHDRQYIARHLDLLQGTRIRGARCRLLARSYISCLRDSRLAEDIAKQSNRYTQDEEAAQPRSEALNDAHANSCLRDQDGRAIRMACVASQRTVSPQSARHSAQSHSRYSNLSRLPRPYRPCRQRRLLSLRKSAPIQRGCEPRLML